MSLSRFGFRLAGAVVVSVAAILSGGAAMLASCGPFTDFTDAGFCPFVLEIFYLGITTGTTPTTYDPTSPVTRLQMAAFLSRTVDGVLRRGRRRSALNQNWTPQNDIVLPTTSVGLQPLLLQSDGADVWVATVNGGAGVVRVRASDGKVLENWTVSFPSGVLVALGRVLVVDSSGNLSYLDPRQPPGSVTTVASSLTNPTDLVFDGASVWVFGTAGPVGQVVRVFPGFGTPWASLTVTAGFSEPYGALFDGKNVWVTDPGAGNPGTLLKLDDQAAILQTVTVGATPSRPVFDQANIWVPNTSSNSVTVVRASTGLVLQTLTGNGLEFPYQAAFDGERILITSPGGNRVSFWKAADLTPLGMVSTGASTQPHGVCSDGSSFWVALTDASRIARF